MCCFSLRVFCGLLRVKKPVYENGGKSRHMCNWWELEKEWIISSVWGFSLSTPVFCFLGFLSHRCGHSGHSLWVSVMALAAAGSPVFRELPSPHGDCVLTVACVLTFSLARRGTSQAFPAGRGGEKEVRERNRPEGQRATGRWKVQQTGK